MNLQECTFIIYIKQKGHYCIAQDSVLCSVFTSCMAEDLMFTKFTDSMKLEGILNVFMNRFRIQKDLKWLNKRLI